ncbi:hypothetical protein L6452_39288 [Arctium lappa]|uniref:Uncharacterized protein n=1 Tax=Arctium lappa TaxID=4217 RepID=A0ACB8XTK3_ARCLA|nr:hypothetical protein L6452_39288 [Arctium lappa]
MEFNTIKIQLSHHHLRALQRDMMRLIIQKATQFMVREQYMDPWNEVRIGKLFEDLDALACTISVKMTSSPLISFPPSAFGGDGLSRYRTDFHEI